ncbi:MAG TPA: DUF1080 domain-containing protein [Terriglobales bacterium]|jgi:hypothetical protein|nr:DUF1080 domain-containing protein [Terriglobales bacterium]
MRKSLLSLLLALATATFAVGSEIPKHGKAVALFNGHDLTTFDTFIETQGLNNDPDHVFQVENGIVHVSGKHMGYIITRKEYSNYYLQTEFKWGEATYAPRDGKARDSGILYHVTGDQKVWPTSVEFQILEGGTGDFWMTDGGALTGTNGVRVTGPPGQAEKIDRIGKSPEKDVAGFRSATGEVEKPHGQWNLLELVVQGDHVKQFVNGKLANEGSAAYPSAGKILFQSEGAEIFFRGMKLYPLK